MDEEFADRNGLRGTRSRDVSRVRASIRHVGGPLQMEPNGAELALLLPWILSGTPTGGPTFTYPLADTAATRFVQVDKGSKVMTYNGCAIDRATFRGTQGGPLQVSLDVVGIDETVGNSGTFPVLTIDTANGPWMFSDLVFSQNAATTQIKDVTLTVDNVIDRGRFFNSATLVTTSAMDRHITLQFDAPYGDANALYNLGAGGTQAVITFTNGGAILTFTLVKVCFPRKPIVVTRPEVMLPLVGQAFKSGATLELQTTLNAGP